VLKRYKPSIKIVVVEPAESSVLLGGQAGPHKIEGIGIGYTPPLWEPTLVDDILPVRTDDAKDMARRLAREEGLFAGTSSGANVVAAIQVRIPLIVIAGSGIVITHSADRDHPVGAKRR
jgi:cysteine synthase A